MKWFSRDETRRQGVSGDNREVEVQVVSPAEAECGVAEFWA
jgi:hypothetical protein